MPRLRITACLSLFALLVGVGGTAWLSQQTAGWAGPPGHAMRWPAYRRHVAMRQAERRFDGPWLPVRAYRHHALDELAAMPVAAASPAPVELVPVSMPSQPVPYEAMEHHLDGQVVLRLRVDGMGRVLSAAVATSSGDPVLDAHALATVRDWRFAVPPGHPDGISGELPMRFTLGDSRLARAP